MDKLIEAGRLVADLPSSEAIRSMNGQGRKLGLCFLVCDLLVVAAIWLLAYAIRFSTEFGPPPPHGIPPIDWCVRTLPAVLMLALVSFRAAGLYDLHRLRRLSQELSGVLQANLLLILLVVTLLFYRRDPYKSRLAVTFFTCLNVVAMTLARRAAWTMIHYLRGQGFNPSPALIIGSGRTAQRLARSLLHHRWTGLQPVGFVDACSGSNIQGLPVVGTIAEISQIVERERVAYVFVALPFVRYGEMDGIMAQLSELLVDVRLVPDVPNMAAMSLSTAELDGLPIVGMRRSPQEDLNRFVKRGMDLVVASVGLVVLAPFLLLIAALIKCTSRGPVLYRQVRAGLGGEPFEMLKFRSMRVDAECETGPVWAKEGDRRRTWLGCFLRRTSLDELPQLINVLRGEMSIVGPRPERPVFVEKFRQTVPHYMLRHSVKAGITGWAQVHGWRGNTSLRKRVQYDLHYITHWTPWLDIRIILLTLLRGLVNRNAY